MKIIKWDIFAYQSDTGHLNLVEHAIYRGLLDWTYQSEAPIPKDKSIIMRKLAIPGEHESALDNILSEFWFLTDKGYFNNRAQLELNNYWALKAKNQVNGKLGGRPQETQMDSQKKPKRNPKEPSGLSTLKGSRLSPDWMPSIDELDFLHKERPDLTPNPIICGFRDYWISQPGAKGCKLDWAATWRNWVRNARKEYQPKDTRSELSKSIFGDNHERTITIEGHRQVVSEIRPELPPFVS